MKLINYIKISTLIFEELNLNYVSLYLKSRNFRKIE